MWTTFNYFKCINIMDGNYLKLIRFDSKKLSTEICSLCFNEHILVAQTSLYPTVYNDYCYVLKYSLDKLCMLQIFQMMCLLWAMFLFFFIATLLCQHYPWTTKMTYLRKIGGEMNISFVWLCCSSSWQATGAVHGSIKTFTKQKTIYQTGIHWGCLLFSYRALYKYHHFHAISLMCGLVFSSFSLIYIGTAPFIVIILVISWKDHLKSFAFYSSHHFSSFIFFCYLKTQKKIIIITKQTFHFNFPIFMA